MIKPNISIKIKPFFTSTIGNALPEIIKRITIQVISQALIRTEGNQIKAAKLLSIPEATLRYNMRRYEIKNTFKLTTKQKKEERKRISIYITFGQDHTHKVNEIIYDKDIIAEIRCRSYEHGRELAFRIFDDKFATTYPQGQLKEILHFFPRGISKVN